MLGFDGHVYIEIVQRRAARYICNRYHNTSSVSDMLNIINLPSLAERRLRTRLVMMYKVSCYTVLLYQDIELSSQIQVYDYGGCNCVVLVASF
jgi:hypothetical protein